MMKKILFCLLIVLVLTGCASADKQTLPTPEPTSAVEPTTEPSPTWSEVPAELTMELEGETVFVTGFRYTSHLGYSMTYDPDWLRPEQYDGYDNFTAVTEVHNPDLYLKISKSDRTVEHLVAELEERGAEYSAVWLIGGCRSVQMSVINGLSPEDTVVQYYLVQAGDAVYVLEMSYFWEAAEGFGHRMWCMLESIQFHDAPAAEDMTLLFRDEEIKDFTSAVGEDTYITVCPNEGACLETPVWTVDNEEVCQLYYDDIGCYIEIKEAGTATVTAKCGALERSVIVRGIAHW